MGHKRGQRKRREDVEDSRFLQTSFSAVRQVMKKVPLAGECSEDKFMLSQSLAMLTALANITSVSASVID